MCAETRTPTGSTQSLRTISSTRSSAVSGIATSTRSTRVNRMNWMRSSTVPSLGTPAKIGGGGAPGGAGDDRRRAVAGAIVEHAEDARVGIGFATERLQERLAFAPAPDHDDLAN